MRRRGSGGEVRRRVKDLPAIIASGDYMIQTTLDSARAFLAIGSRILGPQNSVVNRFLKSFFIVFIQEFFLRTVLRRGFTVPGIALSKIQIVRFTETTESQNRKPALKIPEVPFELSSFGEWLDGDFQPQGLKLADVSCALRLDVLTVEVISTKLLI